MSKNCSHFLCEASSSIPPVFVVTWRPPNRKLSQAPDILVLKFKPTVSRVLLLLMFLNQIRFLNFWRKYNFFFEKVKNLTFSREVIFFQFKTFVFFPDFDEHFTELFFHDSYHFPNFLSNIFDWNFYFQYFPSPKFSTFEDHNFFCKNLKRYF